MASHMLYDGRFPEMPDQNLDMVGLGGGRVYDLNKRLARNTLPSDRVSLSTHIHIFPYYLDRMNHKMTKIRSLLIL